MPRIHLDFDPTDLVEVEGVRVPRRFLAQVDRLDVGAASLLDIDCSTGHPRLVTIQTSYGEAGVRLSDLDSDDVAKKLATTALVHAMSEQVMLSMIIESGTPEQTPEGERFVVKHEDLPPDHLERLAAAADTARKLGERKPGRRPLSDEFLTEAARTYASEGWQAVRSPEGKPVAERTVRRYVKMARDRGLV